MKYLKTYENLNMPQIGDFVIANTKYGSEELQNFFLNNIGKVIDKYRTIDSKNNSEYFSFNNDFFDVKYEKQMPNNNWTFLFSKNNILFHSKNIKDCEAFIISKKYNI